MTCAPPNTGTRPTPQHEVFHESCVGARVMPGVGPLTQAEDEQRELKIKVVCEELPGTAFPGPPSSGVEVSRRVVTRPDDWKPKYGDA